MRGLYGWTTDGEIEIITLRSCGDAHHSELFSLLVGAIIRGQDFATCSCSVPSEKNHFFTDES